MYTSFLKISRPKQICVSVAVVFVLCGCVYGVYFLSKYHWNNLHVYYEVRLFDLPPRDQNYFNTRRIDYDGWTPGHPNWLVDVTELQSKLPQNVKPTGHHEILYYNERPDDRLATENGLLAKCPYQNCHITDDFSKYPNSSAVIFEIAHHEMKAPPPNRPQDQIWVFSDFEPPLINTRIDHRLKRWDNTFNWSLTFRYDSDIIRNYGILTTRKPEEIPKVDYHAVFERKTKFAAWFVSNCGSLSMSSRTEYIMEIRKYMPLDIYGKCVGRPIPKTPKLVTQTLKNYRFYLSFENSFCTDYVTEKFFEYFNLSDTVLVVRGGADYDQLLPKYTHINAQHFTKAKDLAMFLLAVNSSESEYTKYLKTRDKYHPTIMNWPCNMCIKLNHKQDYAKVYPNIAIWWHKDRCWPAPDVIIPWAYRYWIPIVTILICVTFAAVIYRRRKLSLGRLIRIPGRCNICRILSCLCSPFIPRRN